MNYSELYNFLTGWVKVLPPSLALELVNSALQDIYSEHDWSFLIGHGYIRTPKLLTLGSVNVVQYQNTVIVDATLKAELDSIDVANDVDIVGRQFRTIANENNIGSKIYTITDYDSATSTITLDDIYLGPTNNNIQYQIFKIYYRPPYLPNTQVIDFKSFKYVVDLKQNLRLHTDYSVAYVDTYDYNRLNRSDVAYIIPYKYDTDNEQLFEFYSTPTQDRLYKVVYKRKGLKLVEDEDKIPSQLTDELVRRKALSKVYEWCEVNKGTYTELQKTSWQNLKAMMMNPNNPEGYPQELQKNKMLDEELYPKALMQSYDSLGFCNDWLRDWDLGSPYEPARDTVVISF